MARLRAMRFLAGVALLGAIVLGAAARSSAQPTLADPRMSSGIEAASQQPGAAGATDDPWEPFNRAMFGFNENLDTYVLKPVAKGWDFVFPRPVEHALGNFFQNLRFPIVFVNSLLQGKVDPAAITLCRFLFNTTFGVAGFFDFADKVLDLPKQEADFGQTLGVWGIPGGPYVVWPVLGSSNPRDSVGLAADSYINIGGFFISWYYILGARVLETVNGRALVLDDVDRAREASLDFYVAVRSAYLARRQAMIEGRTVPSKEEEQNLYFPDYSGQSLTP